MPPDTTPADRFAEALIPFARGEQVVALVVLTMSVDGQIAACVTGCDPRAIEDLLAQGPDGLRAYAEAQKRNEVSSRIIRPGRS